MSGLPRVVLSPRATSAVAAATWSPSGLDVTVRHAGRPSPPTAMQALIARATGVKDDGFAVRIGEVEVGFKAPGMLSWVELYADLSALPDATLGPLPDGAAPVWLDLPDLDPSAHRSSVDADWALTLDREAGRARLRFGPARAARGAALADGLLLGVDDDDRIAWLDIAGLVRVSDDSV